MLLCVPVGIRRDMKELQVAGAGCGEESVRSVYLLAFFEL